jgi:hypothetical protein
MVLGGKAIYLTLTDGSDPSGHVVEATVRPRAVFTHDQSYIAIDHLRTTRTGCWAIEMLSEDPGRNVGSIIRDNVVTQNGTNLIDTSTYCNAIYINHATSPTVKGNVVSYAGGHNAINVQNATNIAIVANDVSEWNHHALDTKMSKGVLYEGNIAHDAPLGNGIYAEYTSDIKVEQNTIYNIGGSVNGASNGIHIGFNTGGQILIANNSIRNTFAGIYLRAPATIYGNSISTRSGLTLSRR